MHRKRNYDFDKLSDQEKSILNQNREKFHHSLAKEPEKLREHLQAFNDGVIAIIITIIVLEIQPPLHSTNYVKFFGDILVFLISFFIIADFWYDLHLDFSYFILKPRKTTAIADFFLLADLSLLPIMTKWIMEDTSSFAITCFGIVFFIAKILRILVQYVGALPTMKDYKIINTFRTRASIRRMLSILILNVALIVLSLFAPKLAMILYVTIPILSFIFPSENFSGRTGGRRQNKSSAK
ncbi:TMEM175 family protein [Lactobacillus agrestimuris]|uniref:TMEM175 family protein n=1 Tax=Lactobacillus agrestimuris TaxID=2941328 RepID=UPI0019C86B95|nr:TMEM175 family protein [Lactobacillus agrestimuris]MBD5431248.1 DUF1211 domain-containing protein [Lactobacillus sp.]